MRSLPGTAVLISVLGALAVGIYLKVPRLKAERVPLRNGGKLNAQLKLDQIVDLVNRPADSMDIPFHNHPITIGEVSMQDKEHVATMGFTFTGATPGKSAPYILAQTLDGEYFETNHAMPVDGEFSGAIYLSVHPSESFYLVARQGKDEVGRWKISGLTPSIDEKAEKERRGFPPPTLEQIGGLHELPAASCSLEEVLRPVLDGYARGYWVRYNLRKSKPNETLDHMTAASDPQDGNYWFGLGDNGQLTVCYARDRRRYVSVYGKKVTLPGESKPIQFHHVGLSHWVAHFRNSTMSVYPSKDSKNDHEFESDDSIKDAYLLFQGHEFRRRGEKKAVIYGRLPESDFMVDSYDSTGPTMFQWFRNVLDASHPDRVIHVSPKKPLPVGLRPTEAILVLNPAEFLK